MSYLNGPRLHFAGQFRADVSTVNNNPDHFDEQTFTPGDQQPGPGGWNPGGTGKWGIINCTVTSAVLADGSRLSTPTADPAVGLKLGSNDSPAPKLVDLDPEQQGVSQVWGMTLSLTDAHGATILSGKFEVAAFSDIWVRPITFANNDSRFSAFYQSILDGVVWGDISRSAFLQALRAASAANQLSIKFNVDGFEDDSKASGFTYGRITGTIGPYVAGEPHEFVVGRHLMPSGNEPPVSGKTPVNFLPAIVDEARGKVIADFGNALRTKTKGGDIDPPADLKIGVKTAGGAITQLAAIAITPDWYASTAGLFEAPTGRALTAQELADVLSNPLVVYQEGAGVPQKVLAEEGADGMHVRADSFVFRLSPGDTAEVSFRASRFGKPAAGATIELPLDYLGTPPNPKPAQPVGLTAPSTISTDAAGAATATISAHDTGIDTRPYIDGQVYAVNYDLRASGAKTPRYSNFNNLVSVLVWEPYAPAHALSWWQDVYPILKQYSNLYPYMQNFFDLGDYDSVVQHKAAIAGVFNLPVGHPHYMPVTRDLSPAKRNAILKWLSDPTPRKGTQSPEIVSAANSKGAALERFLARRRRK
jgi:hypothetical protein